MLTAHSFVAPNCKVVTFFSFDCLNPNCPLLLVFWKVMESHPRSMFSSACTCKHTTVVMERHDEILLSTTRSENRNDTPVKTKPLLPLVVWICHPSTILAFCQFLAKQHARRLCGLRMSRNAATSSYLVMSMAHFRDFRSPYT